MAGLVVDTDVFSFVYKGDTRADLYTRHLSGQLPHLAFATVGELYRWALSRRWGSRTVDNLRAAINLYSVLGYDDQTAWEWARIMTIKGRPVTANDAWVAAVALRHGLPLVTHNRKHFEPVPGLTIISEG